MNAYKKVTLLIVASIFVLSACNNEKSDKVKAKVAIAKGLYSYGPESRSFISCEDGREYWVADSAKTLELAYNNQGFEKPYTPVYIEVECKLLKSDTTTTTAGGYDSTMVVTKLIKISKAIPEGLCNQ
jgi:copper homeostasis protein (lipoprotein)